MASINDLVHDTAQEWHAEMKAAICGSANNLDIHQAHQVIASLLWLDEKAGRHDPDGCVVLMSDLSFELDPHQGILDEDFASLFREVEAQSKSGNIDDKLVEELDKRLFQPFRYRFVSNTSSGVTVPEFLRGRVLTLRIIDASQTENARYPDAFTVTANGDRIVHEI